MSFLNSLSCPVLVTCLSVIVASTVAATSGDAPLAPLPVRPASTAATVAAPRSPAAPDATPAPTPIILPSNAASPTAPEAFHDPTQPGPLLRELIDPAKLQPKAQDIPAIELRGRIIGGIQPAAAVLEIDKQYVLLRQGDEFALPGSHPNSSTVRVVEVNCHEVRLEISPLNRTLVLY